MENRNLKIVLVVMSLLFIVYAILNPPFSAAPVVANGDEICMDYSKENPSYLKHTLVAEMVKNYRNNQLASIESPLVPNPVANDAQSIWFPLDSIKKFIYHIEKGIEVEKPNSKPKLGLRMYYAAYPEKSLWGTKGYEELSILSSNSITEQYGKKHTLVLIPTLEIHGVNADFNPTDINTYTGFESPTNPFSSPGYVPMALAIDVMAKNHGGLAPPHSSQGNAF
jgi:hypothetical protein